MELFKFFIKDKIKYEQKLKTLFQSFLTMSQSRKDNIIFDITKKLLKENGFDDVEVKCNSLPYKTNGLYSDTDKEITINDEIKTPETTYSTIHHEIMHALQYKYIRENPDTKKAKQYKCVLGEETCSGQNGGIPYENLSFKIEAKTCLSMGLQKYFELFYQLSIVEREAFLSGFEAFRKLRHSHIPA